jgi:4-hydroxybenzoate polyprenyltransferase
VECISALGVALNPLVIFKAKSIQEQWFKKDSQAKHPGWHVTFSENGWTSNDIAVEWLGTVFLPQTQPENPADSRLLIINGYGSYTSDEFMAMCYLNNVHLLFFPAHTSHVLQPLDLGCFSSLKTAYRRLVGEHTALTDTTKVGKANFLKFYAKAREIGLQKENVQSGWKATGLYPKNVAKSLNSRWVVVAKRPAIPLRVTSDISTPKRGGDVVKLFAEKSGSPTSRLSTRKAAAALDKVAMEVILKDREIERLRVQLAQANQLNVVKSSKIRISALEALRRYFRKLIENLNNVFGRQEMRYKGSLSWRGRVALSRKRSRHWLDGRHAIGDRQKAMWSEIQVQTKKTTIERQMQFFFYFYHLI